MEGLSKKEKGLKDMDNRVVIAGGCSGGVRGISVLGKYNEDYVLKEKNVIFLKGE